MRSVIHLAELFTLADRARLFADPELAATGCAASCSSRAWTEMAEATRTEAAAPLGDVSRMSLNDHRQPLDAGGGRGRLRAGIG